MSLRRRLVLAQVPLAAALLVVGAVSVRTVSSLREGAERILKDNYRSLLAAQRMGDAIDGLDREALLRGLSQPSVEPSAALSDSSAWLMLRPPTTGATNDFSRLCGAK